jgi:adenosine deaminase/adenosine deaminase CECR1
MKHTPFIVLALVFNCCTAQTTAEKYFNKIRNNTAALTAFFSQMPKGGDLHHHYSGSIYAEPLLDYAINSNYYLNTTTMQVAKEKPISGNNWVLFSALQKNDELSKYKEMILRRWSVKDYNAADYPSDKLFFESFDKFWPVADGRFNEGITELKNRAIKENVSYIETQFLPILSNINCTQLYPLNSRLQQLAAQKNETAILQLLDSLHHIFIKMGAVDSAISFNKNVVENLHREAAVDDEKFTLRYQNFVLRFMQPIDLFKNLVLAFISAGNSHLITGVNIVTPENGETSMKDYWLHMLLFKYCHSQYPSVKYSMHAGELAMGMVMPEELTHHISEAVYIAGANRIGHGVDMAYEQNVYDLLRYMAKHKIPVEINLVSNEFILKIKDDQHPIMLYKKFGVPIVISSDDAGVLRTNLTEQYVLLAKRYTEISYPDIKQFVYNSIIYSFIKEPAVKTKLLKDLDLRFKKFEASLPAIK